MFDEEKLIKQNDKKIMLCMKLIKKDVLRTLPDCYLFRNEFVQRSMIRILLIYSLRHPSNSYSQGMNDLLAPIFIVFVCDFFDMGYFKLVNNMKVFKENVKNDAFLINAEADAFFCFSLFLSSMKENYLKDFKGVKENLKRVWKLLKIADKNLALHLENNNIEIYHFGFRWIFCLLLREFPIHLSLKLMDYYLVEDIYPINLCVFLILALLLRFSFELKKMKREEIFMFLQNIPTSQWGFKDVELLVSEAFTLRKFLNGC